MMLEDNEMKDGEIGIFSKNEYTNLHKKKEFLKGSHSVKEKLDDKINQMYQN